MDTLYTVLLVAIPVGLVFLSFSVLSQKPQEQTNRKALDLVFASYCLVMGTIAIFFMEDLVGASAAVIGAAIALVARPLYNWLIKCFERKSKGEED